MPGSVATFYPAWKQLLKFHHKKYFSDSYGLQITSAYRRKMSLPTGSLRCELCTISSYIFMNSHSFLGEPTQWLPLGQWFWSEDTLQCLGTLLFVTTWRSWCFWLLVVTRQGCCWTQCNTQDNLLQQRIIWPENSAKAERCSFMPFPMPRYPGVISAANSISIRWAQESYLILTITLPPVIFIHR